MQGKYFNFIFLSPTVIALISFMHYFAPYSYVSEKGELFGLGGDITEHITYVLSSSTACRGCYRSVGQAKAVSDDGNVTYLHPTQREYTAINTVKESFQRKDRNFIWLLLNKIQAISIRSASVIGSQTFCLLLCFMGIFFFGICWHFLSTLLSYR